MALARGGAVLDGRSANGRALWMRFKQPRDLRRRFYSALRSPPAPGGGPPPPQPRRRPAPSSRGAPGDEDPGVEPLIAVAGGEIRNACRRAARCRRARPPRARRSAAAGLARRLPAQWRTAAARSIRPPCLVMTLRARCASRCPYSSCRSSAAASIWMLESVPMPKRPPCREIARAIEDAVAERRLGERTQPGHGAGRRERADFRVPSCGSRGSRTSANRGRRCRAAIAPAGARARRRIRPPLLSARRHGCGSGHRAPPRQTARNAVGGHRAQRMRRDADARCGQVSPRWRACARRV